MRLYQNKSINPALRIPLNRGNKLFSRFSVMLPLTNGVHYNPPAFNFSVKKIFSHRLPDDWNEQRKFLGLPEKDYAAG